VVVGGAEAVSVVGVVAEVLVVAEEDGYWHLVMVVAVAVAALLLVLTLELLHVALNLQYQTTAGEPAVLLSADA
jgi:hypothetical protein